MTGDLKQKTQDLSANLDPMQHLRNLDYARRAGTEGERKAATYIAGVLEDNGIESVRQEFHFEKPKLLPRLVPPLVLLIWTLLSLANVRCWGSNFIVSLLILALPLGLVSIIPMRVTTVCMALGFVGVLLYSLVYLANVITGSLFELDFLNLCFPFVAAFALIMLACLKVSFLSRLFRGNASHGIIDDGTGVAILLELAKLVKSQEIPGTKFVFGFFGAEESGLVGSAHYYSNQAVDSNKLHVISIDMIGEKPPLSYVKGIYPVRRRRMDPTFNAQIASLARALDIEIEGKNFPYPGGFSVRFPSHCIGSTGERAWTRYTTRSSISQAWSSTCQAARRTK